jgi:hypothetical protein
MKRLDQCHLHPKPEVLRLTCPGRKSNPGLHGGRPGFGKRAIRTARYYLFGTYTYERATSGECSQKSFKFRRLTSGLPAEVHTAGAPGLRGQDPLLSLQLAPGVNQAAHHAEATRRRQLPSQKVLGLNDDIEGRRCIFVFCQFYHRARISKAHPQLNNDEC